jgi:hypothetical protein
VAKNSLARLKEIETVLSPQHLVDQAYPVFVKNTPVDRGNARRRTEKHQDSIIANYAYAQVLEKGRGYRDGQMRGSNQAPKGMSSPTIDFIRQYIQRKLGR